MGTPIRPPKILDRLKRGVPNIASIEKHAAELRIRCEEPLLLAVRTTTPRMGRTVARATNA
jgi:hypothetical protein